MTMEVTCWDADDRAWFCKEGVYLMAIIGSCTLVMLSVNLLTSMPSTLPICKEGQLQDLHSKFAINCVSESQYVMQAGLFIAGVLGMLGGFLGLQRAKRTYYFNPSRSSL